jgi:hypothetical protein
MEDDDMAKPKRQQSERASVAKHGRSTPGPRDTEPRERSDEDAIGRPMQLDEEQPGRRDPQGGQTEDAPDEEQDRRPV